MATNNNPKVWFITGTSRGFGKIWTEAILQRGDKVAATARKLESISHLKEKFGDNVLTLELDVTDHAQVKSAIAKAHDYFGKLDIVFNNAGYSLVGTIEESSPDEIRALYETNVLGPVAVIQAALPILREQGYGHIVGTSSNLGHVTHPVIGYYCSSKWAFEAIHESLAEEVAPFNIKVTIIEPGAYATEFGSQESLKFAAGMPVYDNFKHQFFGQLQNQEREIRKRRRMLFLPRSMRKTRRCVSFWEATTCRGRRKRTMNAWRFGKNGPTFRTPHKETNDWDNRNFMAVILF